MRFLNWGKNKSARRISRIDNKPTFNERHLPRAKLQRRFGLFSFSSLRRWFFGNQDEPGFAVYHVPVEPKVTVPRAEVPAYYVRMIRTDKGRLRVPREAAKIGTKIAYPLRGHYRGFGEGTVYNISSNGYVQIHVKRPDGKLFYVAHRSA
ncbi:MAG: hypothetical protein HYT98_00355 [Candidatus Sungbacteria bacterium]|nr:hypothetical protein [Candidatus Sungbacteria bacterium]